MFIGRGFDLFLDAGCAPAVMADRCCLQNKSQTDFLEVNWKCSNLSLKMQSQSDLLESR